MKWSMLFRLSSFITSRSLFSFTNRYRIGSGILRMIFALNSYGNFSKVSFSDCSVSCSSSSNSISSSKKFCR